MKNLFAILLCCLLPFGMIPTVGAAGAAPRAAALYDVYGDGMLFQQNAAAVLAGTAAPGSGIRAELIDAAGTVCAAGDAETAADGTFEVSFPAPEGGYTEYAVRLRENGAVFQTLARVVFGELWVAFGQSNMGYPYAAAAEYAAPSENATETKGRVRILLTPDIPPYAGRSGRVPALPQNDIPGSRWTTANDDAAADCSAMGYWFGEALAEKLNLPVGILSIPLGGTSIISWLSRETIESDPPLLAGAKEGGFYRSLDKWDPDAADVYHDAFTMFNLKLAPTRYFRPAGLLWYQGENEVFFGWEPGRYAHAFDLLQEECAALYHYDGEMPIVFTQLASYFYGNNEALIDRNLEFTQMQAARPGSRALIGGYDYAPEFFESAGAIHPKDKKMLGQRAAFAAEGLVYGMRTDYTMPCVKETRIADGGVYVTLNNTGDGLMLDGDTAYGFSAAGENGVFVRAAARIAAPDTVFIYSETVPDPAYVAYACALSNDDANLYASENGEKTLPVSMFETCPAGTAKRLQREAWTDCEHWTAWHNLKQTEQSGYYDVWTVDGASLAIDPASAYAGGAGLRVTGNEPKKSFSLSPALSRQNGVKKEPFSDMDVDWSDCAKLSVSLRNNGDKPLRLRELRIVAAPATVFYASIDGTGETGAEIPADGAWHVLTFDLNALYLAGGRTGAAFTARSLTNVKSVRFRFACDGETDLSMDEIRFTPAEERAPALRFCFLFTRLHQLLSRLRALFAGPAGRC